MMDKKMKTMIIPGNGNTEMTMCWYPWVKKELEQLNLKVIAEKMPDPVLARKEYWIPFIEEKIQRDENTILIGHSSGATAIMKYLETHKAQGAILVGGSYTDLGDENEKASGYFDEPWQWEVIKKNAEWILVFASTDDPYIPIEEARVIKDKLNATYFEYTDQGHFSDDYWNKKEFPELLNALKAKLGAKNDG
jgi:uncharacterized protein